MLVLGLEINELDKNDNVILIGSLINKRVYDKYTDLIIDDNSSIFSVRAFENFDIVDIGDNLMILAYVNEYQENKRFTLKKIRKLEESEFLYWKLKLLERKKGLLKGNYIKSELKEDFNQKKEFGEKITKIKDKNSEIDGIVEESDLEPLPEDIIEELDIDINEDPLDLNNSEKLEDLKKESKENSQKVKNNGNNKERDPKLLIMAILEENAEESYSFEELSRITGLSEEEVEKAIDELYEEGEIFMPKPNYVKKL